MPQKSCIPSTPHDLQSPVEEPGVMNRYARSRGFTLVEMLVATFVLVIILGMTLQITNYANNLLLGTRKRIDTFQEARAGFEVMTRKISQSMLNTYWDYANGTAGSGTGSPAPQPGTNYATASGTWAPTQYLRNSSLHFISGPSQAATTSSGTVGPVIGPSVTTVNSPVSRIVGHSIFFQAPVGYSSVNGNTVMPNLLNACGYFLQFSSDNPDRPAFLTGTETGVAAGGSDALPVKFRFRLKELNLPSEYMYVYQYITQYSSNPTYLVGSYNNWWFSLPLSKKNNNAQPLPFTPVNTIAQNVIALIIEPMRSPNYPVPTGAPIELAPYYLYDSRAWASPTAATASSPLAIASRNQLPPEVMVTMVAIDEASAVRLQATQATISTLPTFSDSSASNSVLPNGLYATTGASKLFLQASVTAGSGGNDQYQADLAKLEQALVNLHITYRVFSTNITILQAKFSN